MAELDTRHVFVTEIPPQAKMHDLIEAFEHFGTLEKIQIKKTENNYSAFVYFVDPEAGKAAIEASFSDKSFISDKMLSSSKIQICDQPVIVMVERPRQEILDKHVKKDKRNLHLMYEGHITAEDPAAEGVPENEMMKRKKLFDLKQKRLVDTNYKVSDTRLAVFNLPSDFTPGRARKIFAIAPKQYARSHPEDPISKIVLSKSVRLKEVRIVDEQQGTAFLEFSLPEHALAALRQVNNNPKYFPDRRLIVEFALINNYKKKQKIEREAAIEAQKKKKWEPPKRSQDLDFDDDDDDD